MILNTGSWLFPRRQILRGRDRRVMQRLSKIVLSALFAIHQPIFAYSFQTHEQLIDLNWKRTILPFLKQHFPRATDAELERAHAFAYGGCAIQDLGYYPFSHQFFSNLVHYVRSADFVRSLFHHARNADELAFAVGALSHYLGDSYGHSQAINRAVASEFPALAKKYGSAVIYEENPHAHVRTEFAFDINELSKHRMAPSAYLRHVGLRVPSALLAKAFFETYGLDFERVLGRRRGVIRSYRFAVRSFLPRIAYAETLLHKNGFPPDEPTQAFQLFEQHLAEADFHQSWDEYRRGASLRTHLLAWTIRIAPKVGPLSLLAIRGPSAQTHELYVESLNASTAALQQELAEFDSPARSQPNRDLDTGEKVQPGKYRLTDETYAKLLAAITRQPSREIPAGLKQSVLNYYADAAPPAGARKNRERWEQVEQQLVALKAMHVLPDQPENSAR